MVTYVHQLLILRNRHKGVKLRPYHYALARSRIGSSFWRHATESNTPHQSIRDEISAVIDQMLVIRRSSDGFRSLSPRVLMDNSHILTKGRLYEEAITHRLTHAVNSSQIRDLESVDAFLKGFITSERKARARLKLNYILAGASSQRLDESIQLLSDSDEIDDDLLAYISSLVKKEVMRASGPSILLGDVGLTEEQFADIERGVVGTQKDTLSVLRMVERRLTAQMKVKDRDDIQLLAKLINESDTEERSLLLKRFLDKVELLESFEQFLLQGVEYLTAVERAGSDRSVDASEGTRGDRSMGLSTDLPRAEVLQQVRDVLFEVRSLRDKLSSGREGSDVYSTAKEDYEE